MKKILITVIVILMLVLSGCQPTPEEQIVTQKEDLEELIQNTAAPTDNGETITPETEQSTEDDEITAGEGKRRNSLKNIRRHWNLRTAFFKVVIDAVIDEPEGYIPVAMVEPYIITQEDADRALDIFMPNKTLYKIDDDTFMTRETFQHQIIALEALIAEIKADSTLDEEVRSSFDWYPCRTERYAGKYG